MRSLFTLTCAFLVVVTSAEEAQARPCASMQMLEATRRSGFVHAVADRPYEPAFFVDSVTAPLRVHYAEEALSVYVPDLLAAFEAAFADIVTQSGYAPPMSDDGRGGSDALDVYITGLGPSVGALTLADDDEDPDDGRHAAAAHIRIDPFVIGDRLASFAHHEFFHVVQFAIDKSESLMFFESTAVYQEILFVDGETRFENIPEFQAYPNAPVFTNGIDFNPNPFELFLYEYGASLYIAYLDEVLGTGDGSLVRDLWSASVQPDDVTVNEPDWMDALVALESSSVPDTMLDFATWRALVATYAMADDGPSFGALLSPAALVDVRVLEPALLDGRPIIAAGNGAPHQAGCLAFRVSAAGENALDLEISVTSLDDEQEDRPLGLALARGVEGAFVREALDETGPTLTTDVTLLGGTSLLGFVCDLGPADADDLPVPHAVEVVVWNKALPKVTDDDAGVVVEPEPSVEPEPDDTPPIICGCQQTPSSPLPAGGPFGNARRALMPFIFLVGLLAFAFKARRAMKRRATYTSGGRPAVLGGSSSTGARSDSASSAKGP
jgi:hypothetical protein